MKTHVKFLLFPLLAANIVAAQHKPNILWITIEDTSPQFIGCYGNKDARTPVIDQMAKEGIRFTNAFSTGTVCSPSRTAIITGVKTYRTGTGNHRSKYPVPDFMKGFPYYLRKAGYFTSNNLKTDYNVANEKQYISEAWDECYGNGGWGTLYDGNKDTFEESSDEAGWWHRKPGQPFFAVFNFVNSHQSRTMTFPYQWYRKNVLDKLSENERIGDNDFKIPPFYKDTPAMRKQFARVYNSIKLTDDEIGELLDRLDKDHLRDSTIIFFYADHGEGEPRGKTNGINLGYRVPFIIWVPEMYKDLSPWGKSGVVTSELIDFEDLAPTIISLAGGKVPNYMHGRILMGKNHSKPTDYLVLSEDRSDNGIDMVRTVTDGKYVYSRNYMPFMPQCRYIRYMEISEIKQQMRKDLASGELDQLQKSLFTPRPPEYLYDIDNDLWETHNLANDPDKEPLLRHMRTELTTEILNSRDVMFLPEYEVASLSDTTTAYQFRGNEKNYPIDQIYMAASLSGFRGKEVTAKQIRMLHDSNKIIRYWASIGLRSQSSTDLKSYKAEITRAMTDSYPPVVVTAASIAWNTYGGKKAEETLKKYCKSENPQLALMAINYLLYTANKQPFVEAVRFAHDMPNRTYDVKAACMDFLGSLGLVPNDFDHKD